MERNPTRVGAVEDRGRVRVVVVGDDGVRFLDEAAPDAPGSVRRLIAQWDRWAQPVAALAAGGTPATPVDAVRWLPPVIPRKLLCVGANYTDHVAEMEGPAGITTAPSPFAFSFLKPPTALAGSGADVRHPSYGRKLDWEVELAVVIGDPVAAAGPDPLSGVFGYSVLNDLSLRDFIPFPHALGLDAVVSKGFDGAAPMGPWITLAADAGDPSDLPVELTLNGEVMQSSTTAHMIFGVAELVAHFARVLTLEPGDVIATGTPAGVGAARTPPRYLQPGDRLVARIGELGSLTTTITAPLAQTSLSEPEVNA
jgi:2-keto-4-pentenoate hydratase/2-oxohepta-3-ene-1,7-dioic acid hydratase in catechol pathway